ncbi:MAG TPA: hypothetical protein VF808_12395 [Ktedonobacterales bacterium]
MSVHARRFALLMVAMSMLSVTLVACQVSGASGAGATTGSSFTFTTPNAGHLSPTPTFPTFTIGAWPSNYSPQALDNITIYVLCRVQNASMSGPASPPPPITVTVQVGAPINKTLTGTTDANGLAAISLSFSDPSPGTPVTVTVFTNWQNATYRNSTFFTPGATNTPTPKATSSATPSTTPSATP